MKTVAGLSFLFAILLGYGTEWCASYASLFNPKQSDVLGDINQFRQKCEAINSPQSECVYSYNIPLRNKGADFQWIGVGSIISATRFICENGQVIKEYDDPMNPGQRFDLMTIYQTAQIPENCGATLQVQSWSRLGATRKGHLNGRVIIGSKESVAATTKLYEFFTIEFNRIVAYLFIFVALIQLLAKNFYDKKIELNPLSSHILLWIGFLVFASNLGQTILPLQNHPQFFNKIVALFSGLAHAMPIVVLAKQAVSSSTKKKLINVLATLTLLTYSVATFTPHFPTAFIGIFLISAAVGIISSVKRRNLPIFLYSLILISTALKIMNVAWLPTAMLSAIYVGIFLTFESFNYINKLSILIGRVTRVTNISYEGQSYSLASTEKELLQLLNVKQLTFLYILPESRCEIRTYTLEDKKISVETFFRDELPPVFAHVISSREPIWDAKPSDKKIQSIKSKANLKIDYEHNLFSVVPIVDSHECYGAFAFTNYESLNAGTETLFDQKIIAELSISNLITRLNQETSLKDSESYKNLAEFKETVSSITQRFNGNFETTLDEIIKEINKAFKTQGFIGKLEQDSRQLHVLAIDNYNEEITNRYKTGKVFAHKDNEQGPLAVSVNREKVILIQDIKLYTGVFHEFTNYFFKLSQTNSCASIPLFRFDENQERNVWGVIFLEATKDQHFKISMKSLFEKIGMIVSEAIQTLNDSIKHHKTEKALQSFIPQEYIESFLHDSRVHVKDQGMLIMIDLKSSTKISNHVGKDYWLSHIEKEIKPFIIDSAVKAGFSFKNFNWDAFYLTRSSQAPAQKDIEDFIALASVLSVRIDEFYTKHYAETFYEFQNPDTPKARFCVSFGDISMGIVEAAKNQWAITGQEMANLTKLETLAKSIQKENPYKIIFTDSSIGSFDFLEKSSQIVPESGREIQTFPMSWAELKAFIPSLLKAS